MQCDAPKTMENMVVLDTKEHISRRTLWCDDNTWALVWHVLGGKPSGKTEEYSLDKGTRASPLAGCRLWGASGCPQTLTSILCSKIKTQMSYSNWKKCGCREKNQLACNNINRLVRWAAVQNNLFLVLIFWVFKLPSVPGVQYKVTVHNVDTDYCLSSSYKTKRKSCINIFKDYNEICSYRMIVKFQVLPGGPHISVKVLSSALLTATRWLWFSVGSPAGSLGIKLHPDLTAKSNIIVHEYKMCIVLFLIYLWYTIYGSKWLNSM